MTTPERSSPAPGPERRAVILDVDGTLVDSNLAHARAWHAALAEAGLVVPVERIARRIGMGGDKLLPEITGISADSEQGGTLAARRQAIFLSRELPHVRPTPGARELLERLRAGGWVLSVASSAHRDELEPLLTLVGGSDLVQAATSAGDADASKPDPDVVHVALRRAGVPPERALMLGDTPYDVEAAERAGVECVAVRTGGWDVPDLDGAVAVYDDPAAVLAGWAGSPFAAWSEGVSGEAPAA